MADHFTAKQWEFIKRAEQVRSFNLKEKDFTTNDNQEMIRHLYEKHFFPELSDHFIKRVTLNNLNGAIDKLRKNSNFKTLVETKYGDMGPGEVMLFLLIDGARLAGGNESGDLRIGNTYYELKAVKKTKRNQYEDFKLGGTVPIADIIKEYKDLAVAYKIIPNASTTEINMNLTNTLRTKAGPAFEVIERKFAARAYKYLSKYPVMFVDNADASRGNIFEIGKIDEDRIRIDRLTQGVIKPAIKVK